MTPPLHAATGILLSRALGWWGVPFSLFYHAIMDYYPEYTGFDFKKLTKYDIIFATIELILGLVVIAYLVMYGSWCMAVCVVVSCLPDIIEYLYGTKDWDRPLFWFHANKWQGFSMRPVQCGLLDAAIFSIILIGA